MGMFDYYRCTHPAFVCSEGHDLSDEEFQGKDLGCTLAMHEIGCNELTLGDSEELPHHTTTIYVSAACRRCPAFLQAITYNLIPSGAEFAVTVEGGTGRVLKVERAGESTAEFLRTEPTREHMHNCLGPMPYDEAEYIRMLNLRNARCWTDAERAAAKEGR